MVEAELIARIGAELARVFDGRWQIVARSPGRWTIELGGSRFSSYDVELTSDHRHLMIFGGNSDAGVLTPQQVVMKARVIELVGLLEPNVRLPFGLHECLVHAFKELPPNRFGLS